MKTIEVVAAVIVRDGRVFATQRGYGDFKDFWEFPGGKMEPGENREDALKREIREELEAEISVDSFIDTVEYDYPKFHLILHCFLCSLETKEVHLLEHESSRWLSADELDSVDWLPADLSVIGQIKKLLT
ncbi:MAG: (deoxy)nucleoside triphosphate pyrophosphohydrolase [Bacteroidales bacterium]|nr:(deoxy)nucleoside triphosphate pyrophosphohydrolase [Bacteroidales bacterium]